MARCRDLLPCMQVGERGEKASRIQRLVGFMKDWMLGFIER